MKSAGLTAFAQAREEIWLWPSAATAYYLTIHDSVLVMVGFFTSIVTGAITYKLHESLRKLFQEEKSITRVRNRVSRDGAGDSSELSMNLFQDLFDAISPSRPELQIVVVHGIIVNLSMFALLFLCLFVRVLRPPPPTVAEMSLFSLPLLLVATTLASVVWKS